jgi:hypothetical protein
LKLPFENKDSKKQKDSSFERSKLAQRVGRFFSPEPQKEKVLRHEEFNAAGDVYYANVSAGYKVAQRILWLIFIFFMIFSITLNYKEITYDNFFYLLKDFSSAVDAESTNYETLSYESDSRQNFALYRGGIATVSPSGISAFTATGRRTLRTDSVFSSPYVVCSDKYMLVYDTAGTTFAVYNSFARIYTETFTYPITNACFADDGKIAIVTREADSKTVVYIYNDDFEKLAKYRFDAYMFDIAMDSDRGIVAFIYYGIGDGTGQTTVSLRDINTLEEVDSFELLGEFPLESGFISKEKFAIVTDSAVRIIDKSFDVGSAETYDYMNGNVTGYSVSENGVAVSVTVSSRNEIIAFDGNGELLYNDFMHISITDIGICGEYIFLQNEDGILRLDTKNETEEFLTSGNGKMLVYNDHTVLVCGESKAQYLIFRT